MKATKNLQKLTRFVNQLRLSDKNSKDFFELQKSIYTRVSIYFLGIPLFLTFFLTTNSKTFELHEPILAFLIYEGLSWWYYGAYNYYDVTSYFKKKGFITTVIRFQYHKKILFITVIILIISFFVSVALPLIGIGTNPVDASGPIEKFPFALLVTSLLIIYVMLHELAQSMRQEFHFFYAQSCFRLLHKLKKIYEPDFISYTVLGLDSYNIYLEKSIKNSFENLGKFYDEFIKSDLDYKKKITNRIYEIFEKEEAYYLTKNTKELFPKSKLELNLVPKISKIPVKELFTFFVTGISTLVTFLTLLK